MPIVYELPIPPSVNNLFPTGAGGKRYISPEYNKWRKLADAHLMAQGRLKVICGPVNIHITIKDAGNRDIDNFAKALLDYLVRHGIIEKDSRPILRKLTMTWGDVAGARIEIEPAPAWIQRRNAAKVVSP